MISVCFLNLKPGTGKTTSSVFTAAALHAMGLSVLLADCDPAGSAQAWGDMAGGFGYPMIGMARRTAGRELPDYAARMHVDALVIDTPQIEDHEAITHGAMSAAATWVIPVAPAGIEVHRTARVRQHIEDVSAMLPRDPDTMVLINRANRRTRAKTGPDADTRAVFTEHNFPVFWDQVPHQDRLFRQTYGTRPDPTGTAYESLARYLLAQHNEGDGALLGRSARFTLDDGSQATGRVVNLGDDHGERIAVVQRGNGVSEHRVPVEKLQFTS